MNIPLVFFDRAFRELEFNRVVFNDRIGTLEAMHQLISAGYRKIAHFAGYAATSVGKERRSAYLEALSINGLPVTDQWIIEGGYEIEDGFKAFGELLATGNLPEIILTVNDRVALGAYKAIRRAGLRIPEDISIVGYGFSETAQLFSPTLSIINQDPRKMGSIAANLLLDEIEGNSIRSGMQVLIDEDFQWNTSVRKLN
jgi:LacI family transcriptional regulator